MATTKQICSKNTQNTHTQTHTFTKTHTNTSVAGNKQQNNVFSLFCFLFSVFFVFLLLFFFNAFLRIFWSVCVWMCCDELVLFCMVFNMNKPGMGGVYVGLWVQRWLGLWEKKLNSRLLRATAIWHTQLRCVHSHMHKLMFVCMCRTYVYDFMVAAYNGKRINNNEL